MSFLFQSVGWVFRLFGRLSGRGRVHRGQPSVVCSASGEVPGWARAINTGRQTTLGSEAAWSSQKLEHTQLGPPYGKCLDARLKAVGTCWHHGFSL